MKIAILLSLTFLLSCGNNEEYTVSIDHKQINKAKVVSKPKSINKPRSVWMFKDGRGCRWIVINAKLGSSAGVDLEHHPTCDNPDHATNQVTPKQI